MNKTIIENVKIIEDGSISSEAYNLTLENGVILSVSPSLRDSDRFVTRGYVDIHTHGAAGHDISECTLPALNAVGNYLLETGVAAYLPTFVATPLESLDRLFQRMRSLRPEGAEILGVHIEGPFISLSKKGAQPAEFIRTSYSQDDNAFFERNKDVLKIVTLCPATANAADLVECLTKNGIKAQAGHDDSVDAEIEACMEKGLDGATHLYCASSGLRRRTGSIDKHLGLNEIALLHDDIYAEVIADNIHIPKRLLKLIYKVKGFKRVILVSDSLSPAGAPLGEYLLGGTVPVITDGEACYLKDKSALAGSVSNLSREVENAIAVGIPLPEAVYMANTSPLEYLGLPVAKLREGAPANLNVIDGRGKLLEVYSKGIKIK